MENMIWRDRIVIAYPLSIETRHDVRYFWHKYLIWLLLARHNGFLLIIGLSPLFSADDFSGRRFSPSGVFIPFTFLCRLCAQGIIFDPKPLPIICSVILFLFDIDWHSASILSARLSKISHKQDKKLSLFAFVCYPWDD